MGWLTEAIEAFRCFSTRFGTTSRRPPPDDEWVRLALDYVRNRCRSDDYGHFPYYAIKHIHPAWCCGKCRDKGFNKSLRQLYEAMPQWGTEPATLAEGQLHHVVPVEELVNLAYSKVPNPQGSSATAL